MEVQYRLTAYYKILAGAFLRPKPRPHTSTSQIQSNSGPSGWNSPDAKELPFCFPRVTSPRVVVESGTASIKHLQPWFIGVNAVLGYQDVVIIIPDARRLCGRSTPRFSSGNLWWAFWIVPGKSEQHLENRDTKLRDSRRDCFLSPSVIIWTLQLRILNGHSWRFSNKPALEIEWFRACWVVYHKTAKLTQFGQPGLFLVDAFIGQHFRRIIIEKLRDAIVTPWWYECPQRCSITSIGAVHRLSSRWNPTGLRLEI
jgi:hypothetical protein